MAFPNRIAENYYSIAGKGWQVKVEKNLVVSNVQPKNNYFWYLIRSFCMSSFRGFTTGLPLGKIGNVKKYGRQERKAVGGKRGNGLEKIIEVSHLQKYYKDVQAVKDVSFFVEQGGLFAFLGPNGAGKSTTINTICTFLQPDGGTVVVNGHLLGREDEKIRRDIGTVFQENLLDGLLTVRENLMLRGGLYGLKGKELVSAVEKAEKWSDVEDFSDRPYERLSGGQRRRCDIARALLHTPRILFLDEPTTGLDPQTRQSIWNTVKRLQEQEGMTVFLTTHYMEEAENADYVVVIDDGKIVAKGTPFSLKETYASDRLKIKCIHREQAVRFLAERKIPFREIADYMEIAGKSTKEFIPVLWEMKDIILDYMVEKGSMNDVFLNITGKEIRE